MTLHKCRRVTCKNQKIATRPWCTRCIAINTRWRMKKSRRLKKEKILDQKYDLHHLGRYGKDELAYEQGLKLEPRKIRATKYKYRQYVMTREEFKAWSREKKRLRNELKEIVSELKKHADINYSLQPL